MKINKNILNNHPELKAFIDAVNNSDLDKAYGRLKPTYKVRCSDDDGRDCGDFDLTPLLIVFLLCLRTHLNIILQHAPYNNVYFYNAANKIWSSTPGLPEKEYIIIAIKEGCEAFACYLLQRFYVKISLAGEDNYILRLALWHKQYNLVNQLLDIPSVQANLTARNGRVLHVAALSGNLGALNRLLAFPAVLANVDSERNRAVIIAAASGHVYVVKRLLNIPQVASTVDAYKLVRAACKGAHKTPGPHNAILQLLKSYPLLSSQIDKIPDNKFFSKNTNNKNQHYELFNDYDLFGIYSEDMLENYNYSYVTEDDGLIAAYIEPKPPGFAIRY